MRDLSDLDVIAIWERGHGRHPIDQALAILESPRPERPRDHWAALSIGQRDARLLDVYAELFGPKLTAAACCERCGEDLEFAFSVSDVRADPPRPAECLCELTVGALSLEFRVPNSFDLADIASSAETLADVEAVRARLADRCVLRATDAGTPIATSGLPAEVITALAAAMQAHDPQADITLTTTCPACGHACALCFDIVPFLWAKIALRARQLLREVHQLARAYGWREGDVLALSPPRRRAYLDLLA